MVRQLLLSHQLILLFSKSTSKGFSPFGKETKAAP
jgi:hypothetical protein